MIDVTNRKVVSCDCKVCQNMCRRSPCFPTPSDAKRLIDEGHTDKLEFAVFMSIETLQQYYLVAPKFEEGKCVFLTDDNRCSLHDSGLKPTEGKLAIHSMSDEGLREKVGQVWQTKQGLKVIELFYNYKEGKQ